MLKQHFHKPGSDPPVPIVGVHGTGGCGRDSLDLLSGPIEADFDGSALLLCPDFQTPYQYLLPQADRVLLDEIARVGSESNLQEKVLMYGFSGGAQFCHRFVMRHPRAVSACVVLSAGCWTHPDGTAHGMQVDEDWFARSPWDAPGIAEAIVEPAKDVNAMRKVRWMVGCGTRDHPARQRSAINFHRMLVDLDIEAHWMQWDGEHEDPPAPEMQEIMRFFNDAVRKPDGSHMDEASDR